MTRHMIVLPDLIAAMVDRRMAEDGYESLSEYVADLVSRDVESRDSHASQLRDMLQRAKESGTSDRTLDEIIEYARSTRLIV